VTATIAREPFGDTAEGAPVDRYTLVNAAGATLRVMTLGGVITHLDVPDRRGSLGNVVLGYDTLAGYLAKSPHFGAITGRFANRIANGRFTIDGTTYQLDLNKGANALHGGVRAFDRVVWHAEPFSESGTVGLRLRYLSPDGDQHFPGALDTVITYRWSDDSVLAVEYFATTDKPTPVNLTQHSYFNLAGAGNGDVLAHQLTLDADFYTPVNAAIIPTGEIATVANTPFDFRTAHAIGERIGNDNPQLQIAGGYDHNFVIRGGGASLMPVAQVLDPATGRTLDVTSTEPGVQLYTGNGLDGSIVGSGGKPYPRYAGFCLETQHFPDAPNQPAFPDTIVRPGRAFRSETRFAFGVER
jgi:aldose 1-epimerase